MHAFVKLLVAAYAPLLGRQALLDPVVDRARRDAPWAMPSFRRARSTPKRAGRMRIAHR
jgi:hypothetical protein